MLRRLTGTFITGLFAVLPLVITVGLIGFLAAKLNAWLGPRSAFGSFIQELSDVMKVANWVSYLVSILIVIVLIYFVGYFTRRVTGKRIGGLVNQIIARIPFINKVYNSVEQVIGLVQKGDSPDAATALSNVVFAKIANTRVIGMLASPDAVMINGVGHYLIYFPSTPLPATGFNYLIPCEDVEDADVTVEELTKILLSLGSLGPGIMNEKSPLVLPRKAGN